MKWQDIVSDPRYQNAAPEAQAQIKEDWFQTNVKSDPRFKPSLEPRIRHDLFGEAIPNPFVDRVTAFGRALADGITSIPRDLASGLEKHFNLPSILDQRKQRLESNLNNLTPDQITKERQNIGEVESFLKTQTAKQQEFVKEGDALRAKYPVVSTVGGIAGSVLPYSAAAATGAPLWASFGGLGLLREGARQLNTPEEKLTPGQRTGKIALAGAADAITGQIFKIAEGGQTILDRALIAAKGTFATAFSHSIADEFASGKPNPDIGKAVMNGGITAATIGLTKLVTEIPEMRAAVYQEAEGLALRSNQPVPKTYKEATDLVSQASMNPEELSPTFRKAKAEVTRKAAIETVQKDRAFYSRLGWSDENINDILNIQSLGDFDNVAYKYSQVNPKFVETIMPFRKAIAQGLITPDQILIALEVNKMANPDTKVEQSLVKPVETPEAKAQPTPGVSEVVKKPSQQRAGEAPVVEPSTAQKQPINLEPVELPAELTQGEHLFTPEQALEKSPADLRERWYLSNDVLNSTIKVPANQQGDALKKQLAQLKGQRGPDAKAAREDIQGKLNSLNNLVMQAGDAIQNEHINFQEGLSNIAVEEAKKQGLNLDGEQWVGFTDEFTQKVFDERGYVEGYYQDANGEEQSNYQRPIKEIIQETIDEWKDAYSPENIAKEKAAIQDIVNNRKLDETPERKAAREEIASAAGTIDISEHQAYLRRVYNEGLNIGDRQEIMNKQSDLLAELWGFTPKMATIEHGWHNYPFPHEEEIKLPPSKKGNASLNDISLAQAPNGKWDVAISIHGSQSGHSSPTGIWGKIQYASKEEAIKAGITEFRQQMEDGDYFKHTQADEKHAKELGKFLDDLEAKLGFESTKPTQKEKVKQTVAKEPLDLTLKGQVSSGNPEMVAKMRTEIVISAQKNMKPGDNLEEEVARTKDWISSTLDNDENSSDEELVDYFQKEGGFSKDVAEYIVSKRAQVQALPMGMKKEMKPSKNEEFKVGDVLDPQGKTNMVGKVTIREISGNTLKFTDSEGTEFSGMDRSTVRKLISAGSWKKVSKETPAVPAITSKESDVKLTGYYTTEGSTEKDEHEMGNLMPGKKLKKDLQKFAKALKAELGYESDVDKKGKDTSLSFQSGQSSADGTIILWKPNSNLGIYISFDADRDYGDDSFTLRKEVMYRATSKENKFTGFANNWTTSDKTVGEFAEMARKVVAFQEAGKTAAKSLGMEVGTKVNDIWERANDNEKFGMKLSLLPSWIQEFNPSHSDIVQLMQLSQEYEPKGKTANDLLYQRSAERQKVKSKEEIQKWADEHKEEIIADYKNEHKNNISTDKFKRFFKDVGYTGIDSRFYQGAAGKLAIEYLYRILDKNKNTGKEVILTTGGTGAGKSSGVIALGKENEIIFDSNLRDFERNKKLIQDILDRGLKVRIVYVLRNPGKAFIEGVYSRAKDTESPDYYRVVSIEEHILIHSQVKDNFVKLVESLGDKVDYDIFDNTGEFGKAKPITLDNLKNISYDFNEARKELKEYVKSDESIPQDLKDAFLKGLRVGKEIQSGDSNVQTQSGSEVSRSGRENLREKVGGQNGKQSGSEISGGIGSVSGGQGSPEQSPGRETSRRQQSVQSAVDLSRSAGSNQESDEQQRKTNLGNYRITDADLIGVGSPKEKYRNNIQAIKLLKKLESENRKATPEEQSILIKYVGWGGLSKVFDRWNHEDWKKEYDELEKLLTDEEYSAARASTINAHYTAPMVIRAMWQAVQEIGFKGGKVLEPAMGIGHFIGLRPDGMRLAFTGVELDDLTGRIAKQLYQNIDSYISGFEKTNLSKDFYDLAISNVPFADYKPFDAKYKHLGIPQDLMLHDYFFAKSMALVKPGGIVAFITSKGTMDKQDPKLREWLSARADLLGAIRLPSTAFKANAGTEVVTDIIFLRKRLPGEKPAGEAWAESSQTKISNRNINVNQYFIKNTAMVLGDMKVGKGLYSDNELKVDPLNEPLEDSLAKAIDFLPKGAVKEQADIIEAERPEEIIADHSATKINAYVIKDGKIYQKSESGLVPQTFSGEDAARISGMVQIRDAVRDVLAKQLASPDDSLFKADLSRLNTVYDKYVKKYGPLNNSKNENLFLDDPDANLLLSLEVENKKTKTFTKHDIFSKRVTHHHIRPTEADNPKDALFISLSEYGHLNWDYISSLLNRPAEDIQKELSAEGAVFKNPEGEKWELSDEYLSGNVKAKLRLAQAAVKIDPFYNKNIEALQKVIPPDLAFNEISVRVGTPWVEPNDYRDFVAELLEVGKGGVEVEHNKVDGRWVFNLTGYARFSAPNTEKWGSARFSAIDLLEAIANNRTIKVQDRVKGEAGEDIAVTNEQETEVAQDKAEILKQRFANWFWTDETRRDKYLKIYNENFNNTVTRKYDGSHLTLPGLSNVYQLRKTQLDAIWRGVTSHSLMLAHEVGAGKTAIVIGIVMESKRLGLINKPFIVVPRNTLPQWKREFNKLYPAANVLVADERNFITKRREKFLGKITTGNYDAIIMADSSNYLIGVSDETYIAYIQEQLDELRAEKERQQEAGSRTTVKQIEKSIFKKEEFLKKKLDQSDKDKVVNFEELGVDAIFVDEADRFKNLAYSTKMENVRGLGDPSGNKRTEDMMMKTRIIRNKAGKIVFATGTPISNTMAEVHAVMKYLQPDLLEERGLKHFDDWANAFGEVVTSLEVDATGGKYKAVSRFSKFVNIPELLAMLNEVWDIQTAEMLEQQGILVKGKNLPFIKGGKATPVILKPTPELQGYIQELGRRADAIKGKKPEKGGDNMLVILHDGIMASTDMRLIDPSTDAAPESKIEYAINGIFQRWQETSENKSTQIVFIDIAKPDEKAAFNPQWYMKRKLIEMGVPEKDIAFIHDYDTMDEKDDLYNKVNAGEIRILFGSTEKLGAGTNVQERLVALWHLSTPFRPRDIMQREGRIVRPGNTNKEVEILRLVTKGSLDTFMWQMLEAKAKAINQVMSGQVKVRSVDEEVDEYAIIKAASSDNPLLKEKVEVDKEVRRLTNLRNAFLEQKFKSQKETKSLPDDIKRIEDNIKSIKQDIASRPAKLTKETFTVEINGKTLTDKEAAWKEMKNVFNKIGIEQYNKAYVPMGKYQGFNLFAFVGIPVNAVGTVPQVIIRGKSYQYDATFSESAIGTFASMDSALYTQPENRLNNFENNLANAKKQMQVATELANKNFEYEKALDEKSKRQVEINRELKKQAEGKNIDEPPPDIIEMHSGMPMLPQKIKQPVNDKIETGEVHFTDPETEARFKAAHGQHPDALKHKIRMWFEKIWNRATRVYPELPNDPQFAFLRELLTKQHSSREIAQDLAIRNIDEITRGFGPNKLYLFTQAIVLADLQQEAAAGRPVPFGYSSYDEGGNLFTDTDRLAQDKANVDDRVKLNPDVADAIARRKVVWQIITNQLVNFKILTPEQLKQDYFRHQILDRANVKSTFGPGKKLKTPSPGYAKRRFGSAEHDINTNYLEAEFEVMSQALIDIQTAQNIDTIRNSPLNIREQLNEQARAHNESMLDRIIVEGITDKKGEPVTVRQALKPFTNKMGFGFATLSDEGYDFAPGEEGTFEELAKIAEDEEAPERARIAAKMILKASADKKAATKKYLGPNFKEWRDFVPTTHRTWQPKEGRIFFTAVSLSQRIVNDVLDNINIEGISKEDLRKILAVGQLREEFVLPVEAADALDNLYTIKPENAIAQGAQFLTTQWKKWVLFNPRRAFKYNYQNFLGDADAVIAGQPKVFKNFPRANDELIKVFYKGQPMSQEFREFFERGGLKREMTIQEIPEINKLELFDRFNKDANKAFDLKKAFGSMHSYWNTVTEFTVYRESILRYAAYLYYRDIFTSGKTEYGASLRKEVDGLQDPLDKAAKVATELLGDYQNITALGKDIRQSVIPFYSWYEINFKRYKRLTVNAFDDGFDKGIDFVGRATASGTSKATIIGTLFILKWLLRAAALTMVVALYNQLFHKKEESELNVYDQNRMHLVIGRDKFGKPVILRGQGAFSDLMEWVGLDQLTTLWRDYFDGKASITDIIGKIPPFTGKVGLKPAFLKLMRGINPIYYKLPAETITGKTVFGLDENSGRIEDRTRNILKSLQLENEYDWITKKPSRGYFKSLGEAFITTTDPEENAFRYIQGEKYNYLEKLGKGGSGDYYTPRSILYRQYKKALVYKDETARVTAIKEMMKLGVTMDDLERSIHTNEPLSGLKDNEKVDFVKHYLSMRDRELLKRAYRYYIKTFLKTGK